MIMTTLPGMVVVKRISMVIMQRVMDVPVMIRKLKEVVMIVVPIVVVVEVIVEKGVSSPYHPPREVVTYSCPLW